MSRWIDADAIKNKAWKAESEACFYALEDVVSVTDIDEAPSIDIVRCRECKRANYEWSGVRCGLSDALMGEDGFCSIGERRESRDR